MNYLTLNDTGIPQEHNVEQKQKQNTHKPICVSIHKKACTTKLYSFMITNVCGKL